MPQNIRTFLRTIVTTQNLAHQFMTTPSLFCDVKSRRLAAWSAFRGHPCQVWPLKMGLTCLPETSLTNYPTYAEWLPRKSKDSDKRRRKSETSQFMTFILFRQTEHHLVTNGESRTCHETWPRTRSCHSKQMKSPDLHPNRHFLR